ENFAIVIAELYFYLPCMRVNECIPQGLGCYAVNLVAHDGMKISWSAEHFYTKTRRSWVRFVDRELFAKGFKCKGKLVAGSRRGTQTLDGVSSFGDGTGCLVNCAV